MTEVMKTCYGIERSATFVESLTKDERSFLDEKYFISGHLFFDELMRLPNFYLFDLAIIFREPFARLASHLRFMDRYNQPQYTAEFNVLPLELKSVVIGLREVEFQNPDHISKYLNSIDGWARAAFDNCQTRFLSCDPENPDRPPSGPLPDDALTVATRRLYKFAFIGVTEHLDEFVTCLTGQKRNIPQLNVATCVRNIDIENPAIREAMWPTVKQDLLLYAKACEMRNILNRTRHLNAG